VPATLGRLGIALGTEALGSSFLEDFSAKNFAVVSHSAADSQLEEWRRGRRNE